LDIKGYILPDELLYDKKHFWIKDKDTFITLGMTDFAVRLAGEFVFVDIVEPGKKVEKDKVFMSVESGKWVGRVTSPIDGEIVEVNEELEFEPEKLNEDCYEEGWLVKIKIRDRSQLEELMTVKEVEPWLLDEIKRVKGEDKE